MFFQSQMLKAGLAAVAMLEYVNAAVNPAVCLKNPDFCAAMKTGGSNYDWVTYQTTTSSGYNLPLFRITGNALGTRLVDSRGPILLTPGMYSDTVDWLSRNDPMRLSTPI